MAKIAAVVRGRCPSCRAQHFDSKGSAGPRLAAQQLAKSCTGPLRLLLTSHIQKQCLLPALCRPGARSLEIFRCAEGCSSLLSSYLLETYSFPIESNPLALRWPTIGSSFIRCPQEKRNISDNYVDHTNRFRHLVVIGYPSLCARSRNCRAE